MNKSLSRWVAGLTLAFSFAARAGTPPALSPVALPGADGAIGFDDMLYVRALGKVLVPAGRTGRLDLVDPATGRVESISGFTVSAATGEGHGQGTTSADYGRGFAFASDRSTRELAVVDIAAKRIVTTVKLGGGPDYVRWVEPLGEVWVTEPNQKAIEYFRFVPGPKPTLERSGRVTVTDGPESLVIDGRRGRAYTHTWKGETLAVDLAGHRVVEHWPNGCEDSRGIALDEERGFLFVGCDEGKVGVLDAAHGGKIIGSAPAGKGVDIIAYSPKPARLYVPGGDDATLTVLDVLPQGQLKPVATYKAAKDSHCVAADEVGNVYVCDPAHGGLLALHP